MATKKRSKKIDYRPFIGIILAIVIIAVLILSQQPSAKFFAPEVQPAPTPSPVQTPTPSVQPAPAPAPTEVTPEPQPTTTYPGGIPPQLKITSFLNTPFAPKTGDKVLFKVSIKNVGYDSPPTEITITANGQTVGIRTVPSIARNAAVSMEFEWVASARGDYTAIADVTPIPGEIYTDDNTAKITLTVY